nr:MAG TPA: hypothetical protein [Caudoviricetes sp.]
MGGRGFCMPAVRAAGPRFSHPCVNAVDSGLTWPA